jgi:hypothetical protein
MTDEQRARLALYGDPPRNVRVIVHGSIEQAEAKMARWASAQPKIVPYGGSGGHDLQRLDQRRRGRP